MVICVVKEQKKGSQRIIADVTEQRFIRELLTQERCFLFDDTVEKRKINRIKIHHIIQLMSSFPRLLATHVFLYLLLLYIGICFKHTKLTFSLFYRNFEHADRTKKRKINRHLLKRIKHHNNEMSLYKESRILWLFLNT